MLVYAMLFLGRYELGVAEIAGWLCGPVQSQLT